MRFGKEAKIGLGLIVVLLIVFGVVLARRIMTSAPADQPMADLPERAPSPPPESAKPNESAKATAAKPTVLSAKSGSGTAPAAVDLNQWAAAGSDPRISPRAGSGSSSQYTPSLPGYQMAGDQSPSRAGQATAGRSAGSAEAYDPFQGRSPLPPLPEADARGSTATLRVPGGSQLSPAYGSSQAAASAADARYNVAATDRYTPANADRYATTADRYPATGGYTTRSVGSGGATASMPPAPAPAPSQAYSAYGGQYGFDARHGATASARSAISSRREDGSYEIQPNDSYWTISEKCYGTGAYFKALAELNRKRFPHEDDLTVGDTVATPEIAQLEKVYPDLCPKPSRREIVRQHSQMVSAPRHLGGRSYTSQEGDTLYDVARRELGKASRWIEIYELNREQIGPDYNYLPPGLHLTLPGSEPTEPDSITRRPSIPTPPVYRR